MIMNDLGLVIGFDREWIEKHRIIEILSDGSNTDYNHWLDQTHKDKWKESL